MKRLYRATCAGSIGSGGKIKICIPISRRAPYSPGYLTGNFLNEAVYSGIESAEIAAVREINVAVLARFGVFT